MMPLDDLALALLLLSEILSYEAVRAGESGKIQCYSLVKYSSTRKQVHDEEGKFRNKAYN